MINLVSRENGYLEIESVNPTQADTRIKMYYLLEKITILEDVVNKGKAAEEELKELNIELKELCKKAIEEH